VRLGYTNIKRLPHGYFGWKRFISPDANQSKEIPVLGVGEIFPACRLVILDSKRDRAYLQIAHKGRGIALDDIESDFILIEIYNELCSECIDEVKNYKAVYQKILEDDALKQKVKVIGIGAGSKKRNVAKFRKHEAIQFPLFADEKWGIFNCLGKPTLPVSYLVFRQNGKRKIILIQSGHIGSTEKLMGRIREAVAKVGE
jgi:peroxiredoxin